MVRLHAQTGRTMSCSKCTCSQPDCMHLVPCCSHSNQCPSYSFLYHTMTSSCLQGLPFHRYADRFLYDLYYPFPPTNPYLLLLSIQKSISNYFHSPVYNTSIACMQAHTMKDIAYWVQQGASKVSPLRPC